MELRCKYEPKDMYGNKIFDFTKGKTYKFIKIEDPEGWETRDDDGYREVLFNPYIMFEKIENNE